MNNSKSRLWTICGKISLNEIEELFKTQGIQVIEDYSSNIDYEMAKIDLVKKAMSYCKS